MTFKTDTTEDSTSSADKFGLFQRNTIGEARFVRTDHSERKDGGTQTCNGSQVKQYDLHPSGGHRTQARRPLEMIYKIPLELVIEEERKRRRAEEGRRAYLELPIPERINKNDAPREGSREVVISYADPGDEETQDRGVTIISIFGDED